VVGAAANWQRGCPSAQAGPHSSVWPGHRPEAAAHTGGAVLARWATGFIAASSFVCVAREGRKALGLGLVGSHTGLK